MVDPAQVFEALRTERENGTLVDCVTGSPIKYLVSESHPGYLAPIGDKGRVTVGQFRDGERYPSGYYPIEPSQGRAASQ